MIKKVVAIAAVVVSVAGAGLFIKYKNKYESWIIRDTMH